jgi:hypothetical protein
MRRNLRNLEKYVDCRCVRYKLKEDGLCLSRNWNLSKIVNVHYCTIHLSGSPVTWVE